MNAIDFTPQWYRVQLQSRGNRRKRLGFLGAICLLMTCWFMLNEGRISRARADLSDTQASHEESIRLSSRLQALKEEHGRLQQQKARFDGLLKDLSSSVIFSEISHRIPESAYLVDFELRAIASESTPGNKAHSKTASGTQAASTVSSKTQYCDSVATLTAQTSDGDEMVNLVQSLIESPLFRDVHLQGTVNRQIGELTVKEKKMDLYVLSAECIGP